MRKMYTIISLLLESRGVAPTIWLPRRNLVDIPRSLTIKSDKRHLNRSRSFGIHEGLHVHSAISVSHYNASDDKGDLLRKLQVVSFPGVTVARVSRRRDLYPRGKSTAAHRLFVFIDLRSLVRDLGESCTIVRSITSQPASVFLNVLS